MKKRYALVTGASSGIGEAISRELIARGWHVVGVARSKDRLAALHKELGEHFVNMICDVSDMASIKKATRKLQDTGIYPALFFLNAGATGDTACETLQTLDLDKHQKIMAVNYFGVLAWVECWQEACRKKGGANFVVTGSVNAVFAPPIASGYSASKAAIAKAFEGLSLSYFDTNLKFSVVYSGPVATKGLKGNLPFTWTTEKMASYMVNVALTGKRSAWPSVFYRLVSHLFHMMPYSWSMRFLRNV
jgi:3-hydroxy acid dehydrogenase / malonic semialdehyde reductase